MEIITLLIFIAMNVKIKNEIINTILLIYACIILTIVLVIIIFQI